MLGKNPVEFRELLEKMGPVFRKVGQYLALRPDLIPDEYCLELMKLLDQGPVVPWQDARRILVEDIGDPDRVFASIDTEPFAAASIAQVHAAKLHDGTRVAVKIQRPGSKEEVQRDLRRIRALTRLLRIGGVSTVIDWRELRNELAEWLEQEMDFRRELRNLERIFASSQDEEFQKIPKPFPTLCGDRVVTMELLAGTPVSSILTGIQVAKREGTDPHIGIDVDAFSRNLIQAVLHQVFDLRFFHADIHPGNLIALENGGVGFVDFGLCAELDSVLASQQTRYLSAVYRKDVAGMHQALSAIVVPTPESDMEGFHADFREESKKWGGGESLPDDGTSNAPRERAVAGQWMIGVMTIARRHNVRLQRSVLAMYRALLGADTVAHSLGSKETLRSVGREFFRRIQMEELVTALKPKAVEAFLTSVLPLVRDSPAQLNLILSDLAENRFSVNVTMSERSPLRRMRNRRTRLLAAAIASIGLAVVFASPTMAEALGSRWSWTTGVGLVVVYLAVLWLWVRLR